jgi:hypothetical protein
MGEVMDDISGSTAAKALDLYIREFVRGEGNSPEGWIEAICLAIENVFGLIDDCTPGDEIDSAIAALANRKAMKSNIDTFVQALIDQYVRQRKLMFLAARVIPPMDFPEEP